MQKRLLPLLARLCALLLAALLVAGCTPEEGFDASGEPALSNPEYVRTPPPLLLAEAGGVNVIQNTAAVEAGQCTASIDFTNLSKGYVAATCTAPGDVMFFVIKGSDQIQSPDAQQYLMSNDGTTCFYPVSLGDGDYYFAVYAFNRQTDAGPAYTKVAEGWATATLESEFAPFLVNNNEVNYSADSRAVAFSYDLTRHCATDLEVAQQVYSWIQDNVTYDTPKSERVRVVSGYLPDPDETLASKTGICYDYAALAATMLRANGIPCKMAKGDAVVDEATGERVYHAWNLLWLDEVGWVAVAMPTSPGEWFRIDLTFAAGGTPASQITNDANYTITSIC